MSKTIKKLLIIITMAGILMAPACSPIDKNKNSNTTDNEIVVTSTPSEAAASNTPGNDGTSTNNPEETKEPIQVITNDKELDEYVDSISDKELEELYNIIEDIDISGDINPDNDPGFDQIVIP